MRSVDEIETAPYRLSRQNEEVIDRSRSVAFTFSGRNFSAHPGDTIASALAASGVKVFSRSFKYHRPRGLLCCAGHCPNCLVQVRDEPNVRACRRLVREGMAVRPQNVWPSLEWDALSLTKLISRFLPVGFYYKTFIRPRALWPIYERVLRRAAGLGEVDLSSTPGEFDKQYLYADVAVIGGGPAGIHAAQAAAERGARVIILDENLQLGGHLRFSDPDTGSFDFSILNDLQGRTNVTVLPDTSVVGCYEDNWLSAVRGPRLFKIRAGSVVIATGVIENPLLFGNHDLPGVMLGSGVQRLIKEHAVLPGRQAVIVSANNDAWDVAADLRNAGIEISALVEERSRDDCPSARVNDLAAEGVPTLFRHTILEARGSRFVKGALTVPIDGSGRPEADRAHQVPCDLIVVSVGWSPATELFHMAGGKSAYDDESREILPDSAPPGLFLAGRVTGPHNLEVQTHQGRFAGLKAASYAGIGGPVPEMDVPSRSPRTSVRTIVPGSKKCFLCLCEDVTDQDLETAVEEGYDSMELLKRYSTISMGPCQGRMCATNTIHLCARATDRTIQETGKTTSRPPSTPVTLGSLAGQKMEPVQLTPIHDWHVARGAKMMVAGLWLRPEHYGDPQAEVNAVRKRVGLIDVTPLGKIQLTGPGTPDLLEKIYVNRWRKLGLGRVRYGVMCNDEGIILNDGVCARSKDQEWYMSTTSTGASEVFQWIQWWMQSGWGDGVHIVDVTDAYSAFNLAGPRSRAVLRKLTDQDLENESFPYMRTRSARVAGVPCRLLRIGFTGELSYEIHCPTSYGPYLWERLMDAGGEFGIHPFGVESQRILRLEKGHLIVGQDTDALSDAISAGAEWAVKLDKRDFLGIRGLSLVSKEGSKQRLVGFKMARKELVPEEGTQIVSSNGRSRPRIIGWVTSSRFSPTLKQTIGLCWLTSEVATREGAPFTIYMDGTLAEAHVHDGPFYDPEGERLRM